MRAPVKVLRGECIQIAGESDIVASRRKCRSWATEAGFRLVDQTKIVTAASELARNTVQYGGGGQLLIEMVDDSSRRGLRLTFSDQGPGIPDIERAMQDGYTTGNGLGLGLSGSRRLMNDFEIRSEVGRGTTIVATRWRDR
jgi:serine/threonine-protein kinase RsbT